LRTPTADEGDRPVEQHGDAVLEARQRDQVDGEPEQPGHEARHAHAPTLAIA
jgi:hypothetical protein